MIGQLMLCEVCGADEDGQHAPSCPNRPTLRLVLADMDGTVLDSVDMTADEYAEEVRTRPLGIVASFNYR